MKTALVTGAAKRIGRAIAERLLMENYQLILHANTSNAELLSWLAHHDRQKQVIQVVCADLMLAQGQDQLVNEVKDKLDSLDLIVHNASTFGPKPFAQIRREDLQEMLAVNLEAPFFITQGLLDLLHKSSAPSVITILDAMWKRPSEKYAHYAASKAGLAILTRALAHELAPHIRVNGVAPGAIIFQPFHDQAYRQKTIERIPLKRLGDVQDIAEAVVYLAEKAHYATGEILVIDGGRSTLP